MRLWLVFWGGLALGETNERVRNISALEVLNVPHNDNLDDEGQVNFEKCLLREYSGEFEC